MTADDTTHHRYTIFDRFEDYLGFFFANVLTLALGMLIALVSLADVRGSEIMIARVGGGILMVLWLSFDVPFLFRLWRTAFSEHRPIGLHVARTQWERGWLLRRLIALWWFAHFALGVIANLATQVMRKPGDESAPEHVGSALALFYGFVANIYLIQAICLLTKNEARQRRLWRIRFVLDISLCVAGYAIRKMQ